LRRFALEFALLSVALGCGDSRPRRASEDPLLTVIARDSARTDTLFLRRFQAPAHYSLRFQTAIPTDMRVRLSPDDSVEALTFEAVDSTHAALRTALMHVFFYPPGTTEHSATLQVERFAASRGVPMSEAGTAPAPFSEEGIPPESGSVIPKRFDWALLEVPYTHGCVAPAADCGVGRIALGSHDGRFYHVVVQYPPAAAAFMQPRVAQVLAHWRWVENSR
jgi:hypothetical protein